MSRDKIPSRQAGKRILDYPVMLQMLTGLFHETYLRTLDGESPKHGFGDAELLAHPLHGTPLDWSFWKAKIGSYLIRNSFVSECGVTIELRAETPKDIFLPDMFILMTLQGTFNISVSGSGVIEYIEMIFEEGMPEFSLDLIRDFPGRNARSDKVLSHIIRRRGILQDASFLSDCRFQNVITIEV